MLPHGGLYHHCPENGTITSSTVRINSFVLTDVMLIPGRHLRWDFPVSREISGGKKI